MSGDNALGDGQSEAEAETFTTFAVNEWLEKCFQHLVWRARTLVQNLDLEVITRILESDLYTTAPWRKTQRIAHHIFKCVADKLSTATHDPILVLRRDVENDFYPCWRSLEASILADGIQYFRQIDEFIICGNSAFHSRQGKQFIHHFLKPPSFDFDPLKRALQPPRILACQSNSKLKSSQR